MRKYQYNKKAGAVQEVLLGSSAEPPIAQAASLTQVMPKGLMRQAQQASVGWDHDDEVELIADDFDDRASVALRAEPMIRSSRARLEGGGGPPAPHRGGAAYRNPGWTSMFFYTVREGERVLVVHRDGHGEIVVGPRRFWRWGKRIEGLVQHVAHPGDFLVVRYRDGRQTHLAGPAHCWFDPREHAEVTREEAVQIAAKEAIVVYAEADGEVTRRIVHGPATFVPRPGEWLHEFSWHGPAPGAVGFQKVPGAMVFQKLWLMPDQMYHDVVDVRTGDDAVLTIRLMLFFELLDIETMLATTHDPIGDFVNAATSDVVDFVGKRTFDDFKANTDRLNDLGTYGQLTARAGQCGYRIDKVVYRGYGAPPALQRLHDEATESRVRLQLERATQQQAQELEDFKLDRTLQRAAKERSGAAERQEADLALARLREDQARDLAAARQAAERAHLAELAALGVDLTALLTAGRPDRILEVRGAEGTHLHVRE